MFDAVIVLYRMYKCKACVVTREKYPRVFVVSLRILTNKMFSLVRRRPWKMYRYRHGLYRGRRLPGGVNIYRGYDGIVVVVEKSRGSAARFHTLNP